MTFLSFSLIKEVLTANIQLLRAQSFLRLKLFKPPPRPAIGLRLPRSPPSFMVAVILALGFSTTSASLLSVTTFLALLSSSLSSSLVSSCAGFYSESSMILTLLSSVGFFEANLSIIFTIGFCSTLLDLTGIM